MRSLSLSILSILLLTVGCGETKVYPATDQADSSDTSAALDVQADTSLDTGTADVGAPDTGGGGDVVVLDTGISEDSEATDVPLPCVPVTCETLGFNCGAIDDQCGNTLSCGLCTPPNACGAGGNAQVCGCSPDCEDKTCGDDGCGGVCGACEDPTPNCNGEGVCEAAPCDADCQGKDCGGDGCGGTCGFCFPGFICDEEGQCEEQCLPACQGKDCGPDGCGGNCGDCAPDELCSPAGSCLTECEPDCVNKACGSDGCGGSCGTCPANMTCQIWKFDETECTPLQEENQEK